MRRASHLALVALAALTGRAAAAQSLPLAVGAGVDTVARASHDVFARWRNYLRDHADTARANAYWTADERARWPAPDLATPWVAPAGSAWPDRLAATIVDLGPEVPGDTTTYVVRTLFTRDAVPVALVRVYAVRDGARWALANALPRLTRDWTRVDVGQVTFVHPSSHRYDSAAARRAARFVDSAAAATGARPTRHVEVYFAPSPREMARVLGAELAVLTNTGRVYPENALVVAGSPTASEWNPHDLAHVVLGAVAGPTGRWWSEGAATWLGGRSGKDFARLVRELDADLARNPARTLDSLVAPHAWRDSASATGAAVLVRLAFERGGLDAVRALVATPADSPADVRRAAAQVLGVRPDDVELLWRRAVRRLTSSA
ncbi:hypothetical protein J421_1468 [Gemmatirosa kalamazoonensis]|uniref:Uncharacterized protein n=1 Tax=Gemmatirosa kalamazoonensis TaxID=861299 RepID=W0RF88_9BACT|nr:hypothetical protein [Gemmatirosa kalamazoonensis]AHG89005.1 hypothetical protein J421_1468 [Gemmatirosa kalamazoonensis]